jgi:hypothetical protein
VLRMGVRACAVGEGRTRREPQRGGRERRINTPALAHVGAKRREGEGVVVRPRDTQCGDKKEGMEGGRAGRGGKDEGQTLMPESDSGKKVASRR